ncbi:MAG: hypothetical protein JXA33_26280 [Anaerolineae bacterium]|nr:hypothetical protein [Anaerolineae bacterium]
MMTKTLVMVFMVLLSTISCRGRSVSEPIAEVFSRDTEYRNIQVVQSQVLPPYGVKVMAEAAALELNVSTSHTDIADINEDLHNAVDHIAQLAAENESIVLAYVLVGDAGGNYEYVREASSLDIRNLDVSSITVKLVIPLEAQEQNLMRCLDEFNVFLQAITLPETITIQALTIKTELGDLESYRSQIIDQVYAELAEVQVRYGAEVKYEISGLHSNLSVMRLTDVEYYVYLEPVVLVKEF